MRSRDFQTLWNQRIISLFQPIQALYCQISSAIPLIACYFMIVFPVNVSHAE